VGAACARNFGLNEVRTRYVNWADDDDEFTDHAMADRLAVLESSQVGWGAGWIDDLYPDGSTRLWRCPVPPGRHQPGDVLDYWPGPQEEFPLGPTTVLARTDLVRAAPMGGLVQGEDFMAVVGVTTLAAGVLLPTPVYRYRKHPGQMTAQHGFDRLEPAAREHAWQYGRSLRSVLRRGANAGV
jgi:hypothetical protein